MKDIDFNSLFFVWIGFFVLISLITAVTVVWYGRKKGYIPQRAGLIMVPSFAVMAAFSLYFCPSLGGTSLSEVIFVIAASLLLMMFGFCNNGKLIKGAVAAAVLAAFMFLPVGSFGYPASVLCQVAAAVIWILFIYSLFVMNDVDGSVLSEGSFIGFVVFAECWLLTVLISDSFSAVAIISVTFAIALFSFKNWNAFPAKIKLGADVLLPVGFVLGWVLMKMASMGAWMFAILLPSLFLMEAGYALIKKVVLKQKEALTFAVQAARAGAYQNLIVKHMFKANLVIMIFAAFTPKNISGMPFFFLTVAWVIFEMNKLKNFGQPEPTIREITKGIFGEAKKAFEQQSGFYSVLYKHFKETGSLKQAFALANKERKTEKVETFENETDTDIKSTEAIAAETDSVKELKPKKTKKKTAGKKVAAEKGNTKSSAAKSKKKMSGKTKKKADV